MTRHPELRTQRAIREEAGAGYVARRHGAMGGRPEHGGPVPAMLPVQGFRFADVRVRVLTCKWF